MDTVELLDFTFPDELCSAGRSWGIQTPASQAVLPQVSLGSPRPPIEPVRSGCLSGLLPVPWTLGLGSLMEPAATRSGHLAR